MKRSWQSALTGNNYIRLYFMWLIIDKVWLGGLKTHGCFVGTWIVKTCWPCTESMCWDPFSKTYCTLARSNFLSEFCSETGSGVWNFLSQVYRTTATNGIMIVNHFPTSSTIQWSCLIYINRIQTEDVAYITNSWWKVRKIYTPV